MKGLLREEFPILESKLYFNACSVGPLSLRVKQAIQDHYIRMWEELGGLSWNAHKGWIEKLEEARKLFADLIGAKPDEVAYSFGNSVAFSSVISSLERSPGKIIFNELDFPAFPAHIMASSPPFSYEVIESENGISVSVENYAKAIDQSTKLVTACEVASNTGSRIDIKALCDTSHSKGVPVFADSYQSAGAIPIDVKKSDVDFLASGCLKWLVGGFGMSFLYIRPDHIRDLDPTSIGWMGVDEPFKDLHEQLRWYLHRPRDARKFQYGTPYPEGAISAVEGLQMIRDLGIKTIYNHNQNIAEYLIQVAHDNGFVVQTPKNHELRGSIVNMNATNAEPLVEALQKNGVICDMRANGIRLAPHFYNSKSDIDHFFDLIKTVSV